MDKSPAPALEKGLYLLEILNKQGEKKLEEMTAVSGMPKASVNRYLKTLVMAGYAQRDPITKKFYGLCRIERNSNSSDMLKDQLPKIMSELVDATGFTAEWYEYRNQHAFITFRQEPQNVAVKVLANLGFCRRLDEELDAVAQLFIKNYGLPTTLPNYYIRKWDEKITLTPAQVSEKIEAVGNNFLAADKNFNHNGVRRCAIAVFDNHKNMLGVLALAGHYHPSSNKVQQKGIELLKNYTLKINELFN